MQKKDEHTYMTEKKQQHMFVSAEMVSVILIIYFIEYDCLTLTSIL